MKITLVRANVTYQSFFKKPLLDRIAGAPGLTQILYDALSENFPITASDIIVNQSASPSEQFLLFKLFGGAATIELRSEFWKGTFPSIVSRDDVKLVSRCLNVVSEATSGISERLIPLRATAAIASWYKAERELDVINLLRGLFSKSGELKVGFLGSEVIGHTYNPILRNPKEGWDATFFVQPSEVPGSDLFLNCSANYLSGGRYGVLKLQEDHIEFLVGGMLTKLGFDISDTKVPDA